MHEMVTMYEPTRTELYIDTMMDSAEALPMLMRARITAMIIQATMEVSGMSNGRCS